MWPSEKVRAAINHVVLTCHAQCGGRLTKPEALHITLVFLGEVEVVHIEHLVSLAAQIDSRAFELHITRTEIRRRMVWAAPESTPLALTELVQKLWSSLGREGFAFDAKAYAPHITLLRDVTGGSPQALSQVIAWKVEDFVLVRSHLSTTGSNYEILARWPLKA